MWHGTQEKYQNFDTLIGRFISEFGMEAFPSIKTVDSYLLNGKDDPERYPQSSTIDFHNKAAGHSRRLAIYMEENLQYQHQPLEYYIYCTQLMQAECLSTAYRLWKRKWRGPGREYCGGALVWQLNDCWPTQSWSVVDYYLRPKLAYYALKRELADFSISTKRIIEEVRQDKYTRANVHKVHSIQLWATNLSLQQRTLDVVIKAWDIVTGKRKLQYPVKQFLFLPNRSTEIRGFKTSLKTLNSEEIMLRTLFAVYLIDPTSGKQVARSVNWPEPLKHVRLQEPKNLILHLLSHSGGTIIELSAENPVKGVALEILDDDADDVTFDDNGVDLVPDETVRIGVQGLQVGEAERITIRYLKGSGLG